MVEDADVLIVGGGIAGLSAAYFAAEQGRRVTVVDEGVHRASDLPVALINPLRGHTGRLVAAGVDGMHATFALIDALRAAGHPIAAGRGLHRPLIDVRADALVQDTWTTRIGADLAFDWHDTAPRALGLVDAVPSLFLRDAGWVAPHGLLAALRAESRATMVAGRVTHLSKGTATLADGSTLAADDVLWCGAAWGASLLDAGADTHDGRYKPGSLVTVDDPLTAEPMSFGLYVVPSIEGTLVGPTREGAFPRFPEEPVAGDAIDHLRGRIDRVFGVATSPRPAWRGVRLAQLSSHAAAALDGTPTLTALGSRGFLMAPLHAAAWARSL